MSSQPPGEPAEQPLPPSPPGFPVVGIGASAGGLLAVRKLLDAMPASPGMAFVVILHLSPRHESSADAVLRQVTTMPVLQVTRPTPLQADHVYVISPRNDLTLVDGHLHVQEATRPRGQHVAVDLFLRTLADTHQEHAVGIVLSGTGVDGALGIARIKEQGGVTFAQLPEDAEYEDMPRNAIATGKVDFILPVEQIPQKLLELVGNARRITLPTAGGAAVLETRPDRSVEAEQALRAILEILHARSGHDFRHYKRATVLRRIERRLQVNILPDLPAYREFLQSSASEPAALLDDMLISVTHFFRDREAFEALEHEALGELFGEQPSKEPIRVWVPGCATGEEAYSLGMLLDEYISRRERAESFQIFASDIDEPAIAFARAGLYPAAVAIDIAPTRLRKYFSKELDRYRISKPIRDRVLFAVHNVLRDPPFSRLDLISCRNLLIYLDRHIQTRLLEVFHFALRPGGLLLLGNSESADAGSQFFEVIDKTNKIYRARTAARNQRPLTMPPLRSIETRMTQPTVPPAPQRGQSVADIHQRILEQYAPPSVVVDRDYTIVHMSDRVGRYLQHRGGEPSHQLLLIVLPELRRELRTALFQAVHSGKSVEAGRVKLVRDGQTVYVSMVARPFRDPDAGADLVLVLFDEVQDTLGMSAESESGGSRDNALQNLDEELLRTRERLQSTIEQAETSSEELKASNEELQAINQELRSATEELERNKEERQSANEELITVNFELKTKVEETAKANDDLQNFITSTDIASVFVDAALRIKRYTPRAADIFNIIPTDVGRCLLDITHRLDYQKLDEDATAAFQTLRLIERELRSIDGRWYVLRVLPYRTGENRIDGAVLTFFDTTNLRRAQEQAYFSEGQLRRASSAAREHAIVVSDQAGLITAWNSGAEKIFGHASDDMVGKHLDTLLAAEGGRLFSADIAEMADGVALSINRACQTRSNGLVHCAGTLTRLRHGSETGYVLVIPDTTVRSEADYVTSERLRAVVAQRAHAEAESAMKDDFIAVISHELKNPLNLISVSVDILSHVQEIQASEIAQQALGSARRAIRGQTKIIDDLLDMSRIRTGKFALNQVPVDLRSVAETAISVARADAATAGLTIHASLDSRSAIVYADPVRLEQIVWNLLSNAIKFTPAGGEVSLEIEVESNDVRLQISDTGLGIEPYFLPRIFDLFGQEPGRAQRGRAGLGIGLNLVRQLVDRHGGRIVAASEGVGRGSSFTVWIPRYENTPAVTKLLAAPAKNQSRLDGVRILLVEDSLDAAAAMKILLTLEKAQVTIAHNGVEGLKRLEDSRFDIILSDIGMPVMDGHEFARAVRRDKTLASIPMVALSGFTREADIAKALEAGFSGHLGKPASVEQLVDTVLRMASGKKP